MFIFIFFISFLWAFLLQIIFNQLSIKLSFKKSFSYSFLQVFIIVFMLCFVEYDKFVLFFLWETISLFILFLVSYFKKDNIWTIKNCSYVFFVNLLLFFIVFCWINILLIFDY